LVGKRNGAERQIIDGAERKEGEAVLLGEFRGGKTDFPPEKKSLFLEEGGREEGPYNANEEREGRRTDFRGKLKKETACPFKEGRRKTLPNPSQQKR